DLLVYDADRNGTRSQHPPEVLLELFIVADDQSDELCHGSLLPLLLVFRRGLVDLGLSLGGRRRGLRRFSVLLRLFLRGLLLRLPVFFGLLLVFLGLTGGELRFGLLGRLDPLLLLLAGALGLLLLRARHLVRRRDGGLRHDRRRRHHLHRRRRG